MINRKPSRRIVALAQARMGSSRLPNKMMLHLHGYPIVEWVYRRVSRSEAIDDLVFAIPDTPIDDVLACFLESVGASVFRGSEEDVVTRFFQAAQHHKATHIVRICCDNPFVSPREIDNLVEYYFRTNCDYAYNHIPKDNKYPDGLGAEMISFNLLETINSEACNASQREHAFNFIWDNSSRFSIATFDPSISSLARPNLKLDIDTWQDYLKLLRVKLEPDMTDCEIARIIGDGL